MRIWSPSRRGLALLRRRLLRRGAILGTALAAGRRVGTTFAAAGAEEQAAAAAGLASGDFVAAGQGLTSAAFGRERAERGAIGGAIGTAGGAGVAVGGVGLAAGLVSGPVGWGAIAAGTLISAAAEIGTRIGNAQSTILEARQSAAIQRMGGAIRLHGGIAEQRAGMLALGEPSSDRETLDGIARTFGIAPTAMMGRRSSYIRGGGSGRTDTELAELERAFGLGASDVAGFERAFRPGMGGMLRAGAGGQSNRRQDVGATPGALVMDQIIANALALGVREAALPQYLSSVTQQPLAGMGLRQDVSGLERERVGLGAAFGGLPQMMMPQIQQTMGGFGANALGSMAEQFMPRDVADALFRGQLMSRFGGFQEGMAGLEGMLQDGTLGEFMADILSGLPPELRGVAARHFTGLAPGVAGDLAGFAPGGFQAPGSEDQERAAERSRRILGELPEGERQALTYAATQEAMEMMAFSMPQLATSVQQALQILEGAIEMSRESLTPAIRRLTDEIDRQSEKIGGGAGGGAGPPRTQGTGSQQEVCIVRNHYSQRWRR